MIPVPGYWLVAGFKYVFLMFTPKIGEDFHPFWPLHICSKGLGKNHQLGMNMIRLFVSTLKLIKASIETIGKFLIRTEESRISSIEMFGEWDRKTAWHKTWMSMHHIPDRRYCSPWPLDLPDWSHVSFSHLPTNQKKPVGLVRDGAWHWEDEYPKNLTSWIEAEVGYFGWWIKDTVGRNTSPVHAGKYTIIYRVLYISSGWEWDFSHQQ